MRNEIVKAPFSGTVFDLKPDINRYVTKNAESLLKIVPDGELGAKSTSVIKHRIHQTRSIRESACELFPYTEYGEIDGKINRIGADSLPPTDLIRFYHFPVDVSLERPT